MPWQEVSTVSLRQEFVMLARAEGANVRALCPRTPVTLDSGLYTYKGGDSLGNHPRPSKHPHDFLKSLIK